MKEDKRLLKTLVNFRDEIIRNGFECFEDMEEGEMIDILQKCINTINNKNEKISKLKNQIDIKWIIGYNTGAKYGKNKTE